MQFLNNEATAVNAVAWDDIAQDGAEPSIGVDWSGSDIITFSSQASGHWDGFDFTLSEQTDVGTLRFNLGGSYYSDLDTSNSATDVSAISIWIGEGNIMDVNVWEANGTTFQSFETVAPVPEPATMLLFGTGLAGFSRKKSKKCKQHFLSHHRSKHDVAECYIGLFSFNTSITGPIYSFLET